MVYVRINNDGTIFTHNMPFDLEYGLGKTKDELISDGGIFVEKLPEVENRLGKTPVLKYDGKNLYYEYMDRELTSEEEIILLKSQNEDLKASQASQDELIMSLMLGGA